MIADGLVHPYGRTILIAALLALALTFMAKPVQAAIRYVDPALSNTSPCDQPVSACGTIANAIAAADPGDEIRVATGIYTESQILVDKKLNIIGGFNPIGEDGWSKPSTTPSILDGEGSHRLLYIPVDNVLVQNFIVRNGNATTASQVSHYGGGILISNASGVRLSSLTIIDNVASTSDATGHGGGIAVVGDSLVIIERSLILSNTTPGLGGGVGMRAGAGQTLSVGINSSVIAHNSSATGGAIATSGAGEISLYFLYTTIAHNNKGAADEAIAMTEGNNDVGKENIFAAQKSLLAGNNTAFRANTVQNVTFGLMDFLMDEVADDYDGTHDAVEPAPRRELFFVNAAAGDYHLAARSVAIDIGGTSIGKVDADGRSWSGSGNCTPSTLCKMGRATDYGAYEYVYTSPSIRYVAMEGDDTLNNCLNADSPCQTPGAASKLSLGGDEIRIATGLYTAEDPQCFASVICVTQGITITGGYTLTDWITPSLLASQTILDGSSVRKGIMIGVNAFTGSMLIQNFWVRNGYSPNHGGGIQINKTNVGVIVRNCFVTLSRGDGSGDGGGIYANAPANLRIEHSVISSNFVPDGRGGGIAIVDLNGTSIYTLTNLTVSHNVANRLDATSANGGRGGGIFLEGKGRLQQSMIYSNTAAFSGGGVSTGSNNAMPTLDRVYIHHNKAAVGGGFSLFLTGGATLQNSLLVGNVATSTVEVANGQTGELMLGGNAIHSPDIGLANEPLRVINVTIADHNGAVPDAVRIEGVGDPNSMRQTFFTNTLISGAEVGIKSDADAAEGQGIATLTKVLITNDVMTKTEGFAAGRLIGTPLDGVRGFAGVNDYRLLPDADGVDDGDPVPGISYAFDGVERPANLFDIGAYETTMDKENQTITFNALSNQTLANSPIMLEATSSSGLPISLISLTPDVCTILAHELTLVAVGTCTIQANQPGNPAFHPAPPVTHSFEIGIEVPREMLHMPMITNK